MENGHLCRSDAHLSRRKTRSVTQTSRPRSRGVPPRVRVKVRRPGSFGRHEHHQHHRHTVDAHGVRGPRSKTGQGGPREQAGGGGRHTDDDTRTPLGRGVVRPTSSVSGFTRELNVTDYGSDRCVPLNLNLNSVDFNLGFDPRHRVQSLELLNPSVPSF